MAHRKPSFLRRYSAGFILAALFLASWAGQFVFQAIEIAGQAEQHGQPFTWSDFWPEFLAATFENWQSEFLQLFTQVGLMTYALWWGSPDSRDGDARMEAKVDTLLRERGIDPEGVETPI